MEGNPVKIKEVNDIDDIADLLVILRDKFLKKSLAHCDLNNVKVKAGITHKETYNPGKEFKELIKELKSTGIPASSDHPLIVVAPAPRQHNDNSLIVVAPEISDNLLGDSGKQSQYGENHPTSPSFLVVAQFMWC